MYNNVIMISILIAARNEENNIVKCLSAVLDQKFPKEEYEVWIGDDNSSDSTASIVKNFQINHKNLHLLQIKKKVNGLLGKANVLAQLAGAANGKIFLITDADVQVTKTWIKTYLDCFADGVDMASGVVALNCDSVFAQLQNADWLNYMANCYRKSNKGQPITAIGCNMAIRASTYTAIGGYEKVPFSITEDYELFKVVVASGYSFKNLFNHEILAFTNPVVTFKALLRQRRRWLTGSFRKSWRFVLGFNINCLFLPFLLALFLINPLASLTILTIRWIKNIYFLNIAYRTLKIKSNIGILLYTPYEMICSFIFLFFQFLPSPVEWKGRKYPIKLND
jgi:cellulose synthase/poly-beta-1,6-N-acetylglucosamine synthase-like glycosyltransferase